MLYKPAFNWMILAFAIRLFICLTVHLYSLETGFDGFYPLASGADDDLYWELSEEIQIGLSNEELPNLYPSFLAFIFNITGRNLLVGKILNVVADTITIYLAVILTRELALNINLPAKIINFSANLTGLLLTLYPSQIFYSTQMLKDPFLVLFGICNIYLSVIFIKTKQKIIVLWWIVSLILVFAFRFYTVVAIVLSLLIYFILIWEAKAQNKLITSITLIILCAIIPYILGQGIFAVDFLLPLISVDEIARQREQAYSIGGSSIGITIDYSNPVNFLFTYLYSYITVLLGPLPWQITSVVHVIALPETIVMWIFCFRLFLSRALKQLQFQFKEESLLLIFGLILIGIIALFSDNIGANTRLRLLPWISFFIYFSIQMGKIIALSKKNSFIRTM